MKIDPNNELLVVTKVAIKDNMMENFYLGEYLNKVNFKKKKYYILVNRFGENLLDDYQDLPKVGIDGLESDANYNTVYEYTIQTDCRAINLFL